MTRKSCTEFININENWAIKVRLRLQNLPSIFLLLGSLDLFIYGNSTLSPYLQDGDGDGLPDKMPQCCLGHTYILKITDYLYKIQI